MRGWDRFNRFFYQPRQFGSIGRQGRGFTLLELLAVVATIVIFSSILMTSNQNAINQANVNLQSQQETQLKEALDMWVLNQGLAAAKKEWQDNIQNDPAKILEVAKTMLAPSTRGVYRLNKDGEIVSDASINTGTFFDVSWDVGGADDVVFDGPVVNPTPVPGPSAVNPSPAPSAGPGTSPAPSPVAPSPTASPSPDSSPTASPVASPPATASPTPELVTVSPYLQESSLSLLLYPRAVAPNNVADLKVVAENPADVPLTFALTGTFPSGLQVQSWDSLIKADATLDAGIFSWGGQIPANGAVEVNFKLISPTIANYDITFRLEAEAGGVNPILAGDGFQNVDTTQLRVMNNPPAPGAIWDFAPVPTPSPAVRGLPITLALEPIYVYDPTVREVYMSVAVPSNLFYLGFADASGARYLAQDVVGTTRTVRFFLGRGDRDLSGVKPKLIFSSNDVGEAQANGGLGRTIAASEHSESLNSMTWIAAPSPSPSPVLSKFELREFDKGAINSNGQAQAGVPRPAPTPVIIEVGDPGALLLVFRNNNTVPVGYRVEVTSVSAILQDTTAVSTTTSSTLVMTGTAPARDIVDLSTKLSFISLTDNPSFTVKVFRTGETVPDLAPPVLNWKN